MEKVKKIAENVQTCIFWHAVIHSRAFNSMVITFFHFFNIYFDFYFGLLLNEKHFTDVACKFYFTIILYKVSL